MAQHYRQATVRNEATACARRRQHHGPAMRFVANPADWDQSILLIPAGQSGQPGSSHYSDQFDFWYEGGPIYAPFSDPRKLGSEAHSHFEAGRQLDTGTRHATSVMSCRGTAQTRLFPFFCVP